MGHIFVGTTPFWGRFILFRTIYIVRDDSCVKCQMFGDDENYLGLLILLGTTFVWDDYCLERLLFGTTFVWDDFCLRRLLFGTTIVWDDYCLGRLGRLLFGTTIVWDD